MMTPDVLAAIDELALEIDSAEIEVAELYEDLIAVLRIVRRARLKGVSPDGMKPLLREKFLRQDDVNIATARLIYLRYRKQLLESDD